MIAGGKSSVRFSPGYLFARATNADWHRILRTPGVLTVVKEGGKPALLADSFVTSLRDAIGREGATPEAVTERVDYTSGDEVIVQEGTLSGVRGVVRERRSGRQLVIWVSEIGRGVSFTIGSALVRSGGREWFMIELQRSIWQSPTTHGGRRPRRCRGMLTRRMDICNNTATVSGSHNCPIIEIGEQVVAMMEAGVDSEAPLGCKAQELEIL